MLGGCHQIPQGNNWPLRTRAGSSLVPGIHTQRATSPLLLYLAHTAHHLGLCPRGGPHLCPTCTVVLQVTGPALGTEACSQAGPWTGDSHGREEELGGLQAKVCPILHSLQTGAFASY